jgi:iron-sulfur cluster assembly accessory protein
MIQITADATTKLEEVLSKHPGHALRVAIRGGGCAGFEYDFVLEPEAQIEECDQVFHAGTARVLLDPISAPYLEGATLDYASELMGSRFIFKNPNAKSTCGCGNSFAG